MGEYQSKVSVVLASVPVCSNPMRSSSVEAVSGEEESYLSYSEDPAKNIKGIHGGRGLWCFKITLYILIIQLFCMLFVFNFNYLTK